MQLADLSVGDSAQVVGYTDESNPYAQQLMHLGLIPGTRFQVQRIAPLGDPVEIRFRGFSLAIRPGEATCLRLNTV